MCKALSAPYEPSDGSKRSTAWLKLKADYIDGLGDTLDLVPVGGWHGMGRKSKWISPFLLACWDPTTAKLQSVCRVLSGFTDAFYIEKTAMYTHAVEGASDSATDRSIMTGAMEVEAPDDSAGVGSHAQFGPDPRVLTDEQPPIWFRPGEVWEIKGASLSLSPKHKAALGLVHPQRGLSLRFPRFIRTRPDKRIEDATTSSQLADMFRRQQDGGCSGLTRGAADGDAKRRAPDGVGSGDDEGEYSDRGRNAGVKGKMDDEE
mmetsp:Transcript_71240/g.206583  ORF Transcript_71240/g.206583 Transcript_71240/m.206583 type:complete len:261 (+) Transcript_71240:2-784(+)